MNDPTHQSPPRPRATHSRIAILAPGLLGASLARAARARGLANSIALWARRPEIRLRLEDEPWCDEVFASAADAVEGASLVVVCAPVDCIVPLVREITPSLSPRALVTDVGSVKSEICRLAHDVVSPKADFVGAHPMAGSEKSGMEHAREDLFENRPCFVTPLDNTPEEATGKVAAFWTALGCMVSTVDPERHDEIVANISHLPHVLASLLCSRLLSLDPGWRNFAGGGLRDTTRIAGGDPRLWREILRQNHEEILRAVRGFQDELEAFQTALANHDYFQVANFLERGKEYRDRLRP